MPQVIVKKQKGKEAIERLELFRELAKQVLSSKPLIRSRSFVVAVLKIGPV